MTLAESLPTCGRCINWRLTGELGAYGFGVCAARVVAGHTTSAQNHCRIGRFVPIKEAKK